MPHVGRWGTFNHMPFTGGTWFTRQLNRVERGNRIGNMHDLMVSEWQPKREIMLLRPIPEWYRSAHGYMSPKWRAGGTDSQIWNIVSARMVHCRSDNFEMFVENIYGTYPGLASWVYGIYAVPGVTMVHLYDADMWLMAEYGIIADKEPRNRHADPNVVITPRIRAMCYYMEKREWWELTRSRSDDEYRSEGKSKEN